MRLVYPLLVTLGLIGTLIMLPKAFAAYRLSTTTPYTWDGTDADRLKAPSDDYKHSYGDEASVTFNLPWSFTFYGQTYSQGSPITIDTNGNIWFSATGSAHSFTLSNTGRGPVIAAWNNDLSSHFHGGAFVQRKTDPDRVVVEWKTPSYTDEGAWRINDFEAVLFPDGNIRFDYKAFDTTNGRDYGSGISNGVGASINLSTAVAFAPTLAGHSYTFTELPPALSAVFSGSGEGTISSTPDGINCSANCTASFPLGSNVTLHAESSQYSTFTGWTTSCSGTADCALTMNDDASATAQFTRDIANQVSIDGQPVNYFSTIQAAYNAADTGNVIRLWAVVYSGEPDGNVNCDRSKEITLRGGYDVGYNSIVGDPVLNGALIITDGTVISDGLSIR